ncbi:MAG: phosphatidylglycerol:prolipoprotein diacylglycerol transferase [Verrucomicrobia bacterium]|nr:MAG: phosphatidylglycerol:prolipoprotein diacylglycerol transferase [Verrucomicrobiota bacterium]
MEHFYLHRLSPFVVEFSKGFGIRWYGLAYVLSFVVAYRLLLWLAQRLLVPLRPEAVSDFITWSALFGVLIGGRLGFVLLYDFPKLLAEPLTLFRVWEGGMASHGGILGLVVFTFYYARRHGISWTGVGDGLVTVAPPGLFLVRLANFINGELYGRISTVPWAVQFPTELRERPDLLEKTAFAQLSSENALELIRHGGEGAVDLERALREVLPARHPSQIYEALLEGVVLFATLWLMRTRLRVPRGVLTGTFFILYALLRILGEQFRQPEDFNFGMPRGVFLSLFLILIGAVFIRGAFRRPSYESGVA